MYIRNYIPSSKEVIFVKMAKSMMLMALGGLSVLAYQKYNKPLMKKMDRAMNEVGNKLEDMM
jgi:hypothetical protein